MKIIYSLIVGAILIAVAPPPASTAEKPKSVPKAQTGLVCLENCRDRLKKAGVWNSVPAWILQDPVRDSCGALRGNAFKGEVT